MLKSVVIFNFIFFNKNVLIFRLRSSLVFREYITTCMKLIECTLKFTVIYFV